MVSTRHSSLEVNTPAKKSPESSPEFNFVPTPRRKCPLISLTQKAIEEVDKELLDLKESLKPKAISSNHNEVLRLGEEVRELKNQVMYVTGKWRECQEKLEFYEGHRGFPTPR